MGYVSTSEKITEALFAKAGRRYGVDNRINKYARKIRFAMVPEFSVEDVDLTPTSYETVPKQGEPLWSTSYSTPLHHGKYQTPLLP